MFWTKMNHIKSNIWIRILFPNHNLTVTFKWNLLYLTCFFHQKSAICMLKWIFLHSTVKLMSNHSCWKSFLQLNLFSVFDHRWRSPRSKLQLVDFQKIKCYYLMLFIYLSCRICCLVILLFNKQVSVGSHMAVCKTSNWTWIRQAILNPFTFDFLTLKDDAAGPG